MEPVKLKTNEFWGRKGGSNTLKYGLAFKLKRMGMGKTGNKGPTGWKAKRKLKAKLAKKYKMSRLRIREARNWTPGQMVKGRRDEVS